MVRLVGVYDADGTLDGRMVVVAGPHVLEACAGSPDRMVEEIEVAIAALGLRLTS